MVVPFTEFHTVGEVLTVLVAIAHLAIEVEVMEEVVALEDPVVLHGSVVLVGNERFDDDRDESVTAREKSRSWLSDHQTLILELRDALWPAPMSNTTRQRVPSTPSVGVTTGSSISQMSEHPSPGVVLPSSQVSLTVTISLPQTSLHVDGVPLQIQPDSI